MALTKPGPEQKEQIVSAAIARLAAVGFEGFRVGDVAKDVGINNATLLHHYPSKVALIKAVVERFMKRLRIRPIVMGRRASNSPGTCGPAWR